MTEPQTPDFSVLARRPSERLIIVEYILGTANLQETDYLEWKTGYDLKTRPGAASTAKQLIGMANRDIEQANRHAEGYAYVLLGVEPGNLVGVPVWDSSDIETWLSVFVGPDLRYDEHYVQKDNEQVLFLTIDQPRQGDPIYCFQDGSEDLATKKTITQGTIYVRHGSKTEVHTANDLARLTARAVPPGVAASIHDVVLDVDADDLAVIHPEIFTDDSREGWIRRWRDKMLAALPKKEDDPYGISFGIGPIGEPRSEIEFRAEVTAYVESMRAPGMWTGLVMSEALKQSRSKLKVTVRNDSPDNYESAVIELRLIGIGRANIYANKNESSEVLNLPVAPLAWGTSNFAQIASSAVPIIRELNEPDIEEVNSGEVLVSYPPLRLRPHTKHPLSTLLLVLPPHFVGMTIHLHWRVTASNTKGDFADDLEIIVPGGPRKGRVGRLNTRSDSPRRHAQTLGSDYD